MSITNRVIVKSLNESGWKAVVVPAEYGGVPKSISVEFSSLNTPELDHITLILETPTVVSSKLQEDAGVHMIHAFYTFPLQIRENSLLDTYLLMNRLNKNMLLPGFGINEGSRTVFFRYSFFSNPELDIDLLNKGLKVLVSVIEISREIVDEVITGNSSFAEIIENGEEELIEGVLKVFHKDIIGI